MAINDGAIEYWRIRETKEDPEFWSGFDESNLYGKTAVTRFLRFRALPETCRRSIILIFI